MASAFERDESVLNGLQRIAGSQLDDAFASLDAAAAGDDVVDAVHELRKRCKELRALARLARKAIGDDYAPSNAAFRDAARELSDVRDTQVLVEVFDALLGAAPAGLATPGLRPAREALVARHEVVTRELTDHGERLDRARALLQQGADLVRGWRVADDFGELAGGLGKTYGRARRRGAEALDDPTTARLHEWRKRVKYHWYHLRTFTSADPVLLGPWADRLHDLSDALGDDHDLALLVETLEADPEGHGGDEVVAAVCTLARERRRALQTRAFALGARCTVEPVDAVVGRLAVLWQAWHEHGDAPEPTERS